METLSYSKSKLGMHALVAGVFVLLGFWLASQGGASHGRVLRLFSGGFGQYVVAPLMIVIAAAHLWRVIATLMGHGRALLFGADGVTVTTLWKTVHIPWDELGHVEILSLGNWLGRNHQLIIHRRGGILGSRKVRLVLGATELHPHDYQGWLDQFAMLKARIAQGERPSAMPNVAPVRPSTPTPEPAGDGFDPDAALARYLARKAAEESTVPAPLPAAGPARPVFGRKAV